MGIGATYREGDQHRWRTPQPRRGSQKTSGMRCGRHTAARQSGTVGPVREGAGGCDRKHDRPTAGGYNRVRPACAAAGGIPADSQGPWYGAAAAAQVQGAIREKTETRQQQRRGHRQRGLQEGQENRGDQNGDRFQVDLPKIKFALSISLITYIGVRERRVSFVSIACRMGRSVETNPPFLPCCIVL